AELRELAGALAMRLTPLVDGALGELFAGPTTTPPGGHLVVWSLRDLADEVKPLAMLLVFNAVWRAATQPHDRRPRLIVVDEGWTLLRNHAGAEFLLRAAKTARKYWVGLTVTTQDVDEILDSALGRAVITNAATQILMPQAPQAIDRIATEFGLSAGQRTFLTSAELGHGLLLGRGQAAAFAALASPFEDQLITTDPRQLAGTTTAPEWIPLDAPRPPTSGQPVSGPVRSGSFGEVW
ncbi:MAG: hypothetical protein ACRDXB_07885, partial [Actinomycetes bacterium]